MPPQTHEQRTLPYRRFTTPCRYNSVYKTMHTNTSGISAPTRSTADTIAWVMNTSLKTTRATSVAATPAIAASREPAYCDVANNAIAVSTDSTATTANGTRRLKCSRPWAMHTTTSDGFAHVSDATEHAPCSHCAPYYTVPHLHDDEALPFCFTQRVGVVLIERQHRLRGHVTYMRRFDS